MYIALEYLTSVVVVILLGAFVWATSILFLLSQEGAKHLVHTSRKVAERPIHVTATARSWNQARTANRSKTLG
jgi:hypothetical protein